MTPLTCDHSLDCGCRGRSERWREWFDRPRGDVDPCPFPLIWNTPNTPAARKVLVDA